MSWRQGRRGATDGYAKALAGDRTLDDLAKVIEKTMPEDDPGACVGEEARLVAAYMYDAFYSRECSCAIIRRGLN